MNKIRHFIKGIVIGSTMMVPGVSGGTTALILGIYDDLIKALSNLFTNFKENMMFLSIVGSGGLIGLFSISFVIEYFIINYNYPTMFLFLGIVTGGLPVLYKEANKGSKTKKDILWFFLGFIIIAILLYLDSNVEKSLFTFENLTLFTSIYLIMAGFIIAIGLILPGVSTSFMFLVLGLLTPTINAVKTLNIPFLAPLALGIIVGVFGTTKLLEKLLYNYPRPTYLMILGFVIASLFEVFPGVPRGTELVISILTFTVGFVIIKYVSEKYND
jgi:putative membrane protein